MSQYEASSTITVKEEPSEDHLTPPDSPLDLCLRNTEYKMQRTEIPVHLSEQNNNMYSINTDKTRALQNIQRRNEYTMLPSEQIVVPPSELSPQSLNSISSPEHPCVSSPTYVQYEGLANKLAPVVTKSKVTRPFKAFPSHPVPIHMQSTSLDVTRNAGYFQFRSQMLHQLQNQNIGATNKNMRRSTNSSQSEQNSDPSYREKRKKNNEAAKRSRDARRAKEDEIAIRCAFLEQENIRLNAEYSQMKHENTELKLRVARLEAMQNSFLNMALVP
ncbi:hypothetical protein WA026_009778 [Henosepilachna vigintioctopunctata]|uniref:BZIP domain-containing protein n=1 Tax=Henosepilachna vigintioctopunctata TaxID=420089 RepID=A0AAW1TRR1_9CUCU